MTVKSIVLAYLRRNGYDGLWSHRYDCGCETKDLMPCECEGIEYCEPGWKRPCEPETCPADGECEWHIGPKCKESK